MSIYHKTIVFIAISFFVILSVGYYIWSKEKKTLENLSNLQVQEDIKNFQNILDLHTKNLKILAKDYSYWDELYNFTKEPEKNIDWAEKNLTQALNDFESDFLIILDNNLNVLYEVKKKEIINLVERIKSNYTNQFPPEFSEFYININNNPVQIISAPIHPSKESAKISPPNGFLLVGKDWDKSFIDAISRTTHSKIELVPGNNLLSSPDYFVYNLNSLRGDTLFQLKISKKENILNHIEKFVKKEFFTIIIFATLMLILFSFFFFKFIGKPLHRIETALKTKNSSDISDLEQRPDEIGKIANLVKSFFDQNLLLEQYMKVIEASTIVSKIDSKGVIIYINEEFSKTTGYLPDEIIGKEFKVIINHPENPKDLYDNILTSILKGKVWKGIFKTKDKNNQTIYLSTTIIPIFDSNNNISHHIVLKQDITPFFDQIKLIESQVTDSLTGLPNRIKLMEDIKDQEDYSLAILDINRFRDINEAYSYEFGDMVIVETARLLREKFPLSIKIYRLSADRFALYNKSTLSTENFNNFCNEFIQYFKENQVVINDIPLNIRFRAGISHNSPKNLMLSELSLNYAEEKGLDLVCFNDNKDIQNRLKNSLTLTKKIREGLENDRLLVYYQKVVSATDPDFFKIECLFRLKDENDAVLSPHIFLEHAKKAGLYSDISQQVLKKIFTFFSQNDIVFSINLTMEDILNKDTTNMLFDIIDTYNYKNRVIFELVESEEMVKNQMVDNFFTKAREYGCKIAIDDFGSGYSNFEYLIKLKVDFIKIDGSLIHNLHKDLNSRIIVKTIVSFAKKLNLKVIAEFIHCEEIFKICKDMGIDYLQGFYIHKPEPIENLTHLNINSRFIN